ncbi:elongation factor EF-G [Coniosporium apollinis CBS 100218]|uniref:Ribosome-releasing factor 2, mitochondrial n=1 Tax=Coniosporium apollinis (strain CBS 100218) TaxID=1168221 RepID=R7Z324_CONA1|nr:elongation factor EF-G [Coniosporium apollinis CBS 100218]EON68331.1 elongation factor EF-G [Coniosporium apollinis CBS 100218]
MLYYSGYTRRIGDVDEGSTVTDFLPAERARGITIQSAAITFHWPTPVDQPVPQQISKPTKKFNNSVEAPPLARSSIPHNINLIDTPGHADFTFEVVRSLRILDGAVCILDGVAGVEAQTEKVWTQANHYRIPRIIYVNKLDRDGAAFGRTVREIGVRLHCWPAVCQVPWWQDGNGKLVGVGDAVGLRALRWQEGGDGKTVQVLSRKELSAENPKLVGEIKKARVALVELLSEHDDEMVEKFLEYGEDHLAIPASDITESLRKCVLQYPQRIVPVFAGASFRNIGVQPLLDAVVDLLPSPEERPDPEVRVGSSHGGLQDLLSGRISLAQEVAETPAKGKNAVAGRPDKSTVMLQNLEACALAFKVVNDARRGVLVYVRVYSGSLARNAALYNTNLHVTERAPRLLKMYASDAVEIPAIPAGQIGVIVGLKHARTGDTLISYTGVNPKVGPPAPINSLQLRPINVPPPVFFTSVEPNSLAEEKHLSETLAILLREDPSLNVSLDPESGQTHLAGMGELHLEIARDRLINDFKTKAATGAIEISYREAILSATSLHTELVNREVAGKPSHASCTASVSPTDVSASEASDHPYETIVQLDTNQLIIHHPTLTRSGLPVSSEQPPLPVTLPFTAVIAALTSGVSAALARGPAHRYPIHSAQVNISFDHTRDVFADTTPAALSNAARLAVQAALKAASVNGGSVLMEPVMMVTIAVPEGDLGSVVQDISSARGGQVLSLDGDTAAEDSESDGSSPPGVEDFRIVNPKNIYAPPDPFEGNMSDDHAYHDFGAGAGKQRQITARVPLKEMIGYLKHLRSLTGGRGTFVMTVDRFERMSAQRQKAVLNEMSGGFA